MSTIYTRWQIQTIKQAMQERRILLLAGARQCGKTTLAHTLATPNTIYRTLDDVTLLEAAQNDPHEFVRHDHQMLIIDEVQRVPTLLLAIKKAVDENTRPGQYLLTGSADIQTLPSVRESLAGRVYKIRLRSLSQGEIAGQQPTFLAQAFDQSFAATASQLTRDELLMMACRGGYPEVLGLTDQAQRKWHKDYINALLERDLKDIAKIQRHDAMRELLYVLSAWSSKPMDIAAIGAGLAIRRPTVESYINALEALYLVERVPPWTRTDYARVGKQHTVFMTDSGLMSSLLNWNIDQIRFDSDRLGKLTETWVFHQLATQVDCAADRYQLFHYRDREQREIDFLLERDDGSLLGIEVKAGSAISRNHFKHLRWFRDTLAGDRPFVGIVLYTGEFAVSFGKNLWAVPLATLI